MDLENSSNPHNLSSFVFSTYSSTIVMHCEKLLSLVLNRTTVLNNQPSTPPYIRELLAKKNLTLRLPKTILECVDELSRLLNSTNETNISNKNIQQNYGIQERSRSLIVFVILIAFVSLISIVGNLCLAKVLYSKRCRLLQTDRIVLCLALSELCLVLIDSPTEIYRFLSYSFSQTWLCQFHTFFESFFSSCIIFYHLLGAFDRFVYIHGHISSNISLWSKCFLHISSKSCSILLLILPILCSLPIAICNLLHAHVMLTTSNVKICIVQYTHGILISFLIFFYILPLLFSFFLHAKLIYFIRSKHHQHYLSTTISHVLPKLRKNTLDTPIPMQKQKSNIQNQNKRIHNQQLLQPNKTNTKTSSNRRIFMFNTDTNVNTAGTIMTTTTAGGGGGGVVGRQQIGTNNSSNSSQSSRSSTGTNFTSLTSPTILYKINSQANANAKRTILLLVLLLSFYVLCWAPYNIYTWYHAYQLTTNNQNDILLNHTLISDLNQTIISLTDNLHADLRRIIFINYSLYLLSMISMCFSFIFYFSLNKQARYEFSDTIGCICPWIVDRQNQDVRKKSSRQDYERPKQLQYYPRYQHHYPKNNQNILPIQNNNPRIKTTKFNTHPMIVPTRPLLIDRQKNNKKYINSSSPKFDNGLSKRPVITYGCHVQCCP